MIHSDLSDVLSMFSKQKNMCLPPPQRPWDCTSDLLPNSMPQGQDLSSLTQKEKLWLRL